MKQPEGPWDAGCRCGAVRFRVTQPAIMTMACHCTGCQKMTASAFSTTIMVPSGAVEMVAGETVRGGLGEGMADHRFCAACKTWLFTRFAPDQGFVNVRAPSLDDHSWFAPFAEAYTSEALPWAKTGAQVSYPKFPEEADYPKVMAAFAEWTA